MERMENDPSKPPATREFDEMEVARPVQPVRSVSRLWFFTNCLMEGLAVGVGVGVGEGDGEPVHSVAAHLR